MVGAMPAYDVLKTLHIADVVLLVGNVTVTSIWKLYADATRDPAVIAFAQRLVTVTDWFFTFWGIVLMLAGGYGAAWVGGHGRAARRLDRLVGGDGRRWRARSGSASWCRSR